MSRARSILAVPESELLRAAVIIIDGRSGSGKTVLAGELLARLRSAGQPAALLRVEDLYPGWDGLAEGAAALPEVLRGREYRRYDWHREQFSERREAIPGGRLVVEGCGALTADSLEAAEEYAAARAPGPILGIWIDCPEEMRRERALARDGESYAPHWDRWAAQEDAFFGRQRPWELAALRLNCAG